MMSDSKPIGNLTVLTDDITGRFKSHQGPINWISGSSNSITKVRICLFHFLTSLIIIPAS